MGGYRRACHSQFPRAVQTDPPWRYRCGALPNRHVRRDRTRSEESCLHGQSSSLGLLSAGHPGALTCDAALRDSSLSLRARARPHAPRCDGGGMLTAQRGDDPRCPRRSLYPSNVNLTRWRSISFNVRTQLRSQHGRVPCPFMRAPRGSHQPPQKIFVVVVTCNTTGLLIRRPGGHCRQEVYVKLCSCARTPRISRSLLSDRILRCCHRAPAMTRGPSATV